MDTEYVIPWRDVETPTVGEQPVSIHVRYDRQELHQNNMVGVTASVEVADGSTVGMLLVDLGVPPGFTPLTSDLDALVKAEIIECYELTGRQIIFYLTNVAGGDVQELTYRLQARFPIRGQTPPSSVYNYYAPDQRATEPPQRVTVTLGTPD